MQIIDKKIREKWKNYLWQSTAAGISLLLILIVFESAIGLVIKAAIGATAFTVFAIPNHTTARIRNVVGGQGIGIAVGLACSFIPMLPAQGGLAVGLGTLLMVTMNAEHPPAAGTALGLSIDWSPEGAVFVLSAAVILSLVRRRISEKLVDLT